MEILEELRALYQQEKNVEMQVKVGDEAKITPLVMCWSQFIFHATPRLWGHKFIQLILTPAWQKIVDRLV